MEENATCKRSRIRQPSTIAINSPSSHAIDSPRYRISCDLFSSPPFYISRESDFDFFSLFDRCGVCVLMCVAKCREKHWLGYVSVFDRFVTANKKTNIGRGANTGIRQTENEWTMTWRIVREKIKMAPTTAPEREKKCGYRPWNSPWAFNFNCEREESREEEIKKTNVKRAILFFSYLHLIVDRQKYDEYSSTYQAITVHHYYCSLCSFLSQQKFIGTPQTIRPAKL